MLRAYLPWIMFVVCAIYPRACFATTYKDVQIGMRVMNFLVNPPPSRSSVAIFFDLRSKESQDDAQKIMDWFSADSDAAKTDLIPLLVDVRGLESAVGVRVGFVADAMEAHYPAILEFAKRNGVLTISSDLSCVRSGKCMVRVSSASRVEVIVNRQVSEESGVNFTEAFRMMISEY